MYINEKVTNIFFEINQNKSNINQYIYILRKSLNVFNREDVCEHAYEHVYEHVYEPWRRG